MKRFKIKDKIDGNTAMIIAENKKEMLKFIKTETNIGVKIIETIKVQDDEIKRIIYNDIVPF